MFAGDSIRVPGSGPAIREFGWGPNLFKRRLGDGGQYPGAVATGSCPRDLKAVER
jgi:hypothetical protein